MRKYSSKLTKTVQTTSENDNYIEIRLPKLPKILNLSFSSLKQKDLAPFLVVALFIAAYLLGTLTEKLHLFVK